MAKRKKRSVPPPDLDTLLDKLKKQVGPVGVKLAEQIASTTPFPVLNLAFRLVPKREIRLTKPQQKFYEEMRAQDPKAADEWKTKKLNERLAHFSAPSQKKAVKR